MSNRADVTLTVLFLLATTAFSALANSAISAQTAFQSTADASPNNSLDQKHIIYINKKYRFRFSLPASWKGYSITVNTWSGTVPDQDPSTPGKLEAGEIISIVHPLSTEAHPRQNIPIMVFTCAQWTLIDHDDLIVSAAPIGPSEIGRNAKYVFALPARYNYAFPTGFEEVEQIIQHHPLHGY